MPGNTKLSVAILGSAYPLRGGIAAYNERIAIELIREGHSVKIYNFRLQYPSILFPGKTQYSSETPPADILIDTCVNSVNPLNWLNVGKKIRNARYDLMIVKYWLPFMAPCLGTISGCVRRNSGIRVVSIVDNIIPHEKRPVDRLLSSYFVKRVDGFVAMSEAVLNDLELFDREKKKVFCPHPLYDSFGDAMDKTEAKKRLELDPAFNYILFFGFIRDYKGLDILLDAFADERFRNMPVKLLVAGEFYTDPQPYHQIIEKHNLQDKVIMSNDFIPDSRVGEYFCAADMVVQPYKDATQSGVTQIAYHFNKPMIVTNVGGLPEIVPHGKVGYVCMPDRISVADAMVKFYEEDREREFSANAAAEKSQYSWRRMLDAVFTAAGL